MRIFILSSYHCWCFYGNGDEYDGYHGDADGVFFTGIGQSVSPTRAMCRREATSSVLRTAAPTLGCAGNV